MDRRFTSDRQGSPDANRQPPGVDREGTLLALFASRPAPMPPGPRHHLRVQASPEVQAMARAAMADDA